MAILSYIAPLVLITMLLFSSCSTKPEEQNVQAEEPGSAPVKKTESLSEGEKVYSVNCNICHGPDGKKQLAGAKDLATSTLTLEQRIEQITNGKKTDKTVMPAYKGTLTENQIREVAIYLDSLKK